jgi:integrase
VDVRPRYSQNMSYPAQSVEPSSGSTSRIVPCRPELVVLLRNHLRQFGTDDKGRVFTGERGGPLPTITYERVWRRARQALFTLEMCARPWPNVHTTSGIPPSRPGSSAEYQLPK